MNLNPLLIASICFAMISCSNKTEQMADEISATEITTSDSVITSGFKVFESDTALIKNKRYALTVYRNDSACFFTVAKEVSGQFKIMMKDPEYGTNNSDISFKDQNEDGYLDIVWNKKWQEHAYLFNPGTECFVEVGEFHSIDTLKIDNTPVVYKSQYPILYYWNYEKAYDMAKCSEDTLFTDNHSELFVIDDNYQKISFATLDNLATTDKPFRDTIECGAQIVNCYVPPYYGKYGDNSLWNSGVSVDSFYLPPNASFFNSGSYAIDSAYITKYWLKNYVKLLSYGQVFKVRRDKPLQYYK